MRCWCVDTCMMELLALLQMVLNLEFSYPSLVSKQRLRFHSALRQQLKESDINSFQCIFYEYKLNSFNWKFKKTWKSHFLQHLNILVLFTSLYFWNRFACFAYYVVFCFFFIFTNQVSCSYFRERQRINSLKYIPDVEVLFFTSTQLPA